MREIGNDDSELDPDDFVVDPHDINLCGYSLKFVTGMVAKFDAIAAKHGMTPDEYRKYRALIAEAERIKSWAERRLHPVP
jgi:hypothetical protein